MISVPTTGSGGSTVWYQYQTLLVVAALYDFSTKHCQWWQHSASGGSTVWYQYQALPLVAALYDMISVPNTASGGSTVWYQYQTLPVVAALYDISTKHCQWWQHCMISVPNTGSGGSTVWCDQLVHTNPFSVYANFHDFQNVILLNIKN